MRSSIQQAHSAVFSKAFRSSQNPSKNTEKILKKNFQKRKTTQKEPVFSLHNPVFRFFQPAPSNTPEGQNLNLPNSCTRQQATGLGKPVPTFVIGDWSFPPTRNAEREKIRLSVPTQPETCRQPQKKDRETDSAERKQQTIPHLKCIIPPKP